MKFLAWHMGLGDAIAFAELAVNLADGEPMMVLCWRKNEVSVRSLFVNHPNIGTVVVDSDAEVVQMGTLDNAINIGHYSGIPRNYGEDLIEWVYRTAGVVHEFRFDQGVVAKACERMGQILISTQFPWPLIHDDKERGFVIREQVPDYWKSLHDEGSILRWRDTIQAAPEIHCIDSALLHLVEQLQPTGKLFYHKYARPGSENYRTLRHNWTVLE